MVEIEPIPHDSACVLCTSKPMLLKLFELGAHVVEKEPHHLCEPHVRMVSRRREMNYKEAQVIFDALTKQFNDYGDNH